MSNANREPSMDAAESETLRMRGNSMHGNRETLETPSPRGGGRSEKAFCRNADMHVSRESDGPIVPEKRANKAGPKAWRRSPWREGDRPRETPHEPYSHRTQSRGSVASGLRGVREAAKRDKKMRFTALLHHVTPELLRAAISS